MGGNPSPTTHPRTPLDLARQFTAICSRKPVVVVYGHVASAKKAVHPPRRLLMPTIPENFFRDLLQRKTLERIKWAIFVSVPVWFGYGFARNPDNLEWVKQVFPTAAADPQGHGGRDLPTLADALAQITLEEKIDHALEELRKKKAAQQK